MPKKVLRRGKREDPPENVGLTKDRWDSGNRSHTAGGKKGTTCESEKNELNRNSRKDSWGER